jgi:hypothetical protein
MQKSNLNRSSSQASSKTITSIHSTEAGTKNCKTLDDALFFFPVSINNALKTDVQT